MSIAVQGDEKAMKPVDLRQNLYPLIKKYSNVAITDKQLTELESVLSKVLTPKQTQHAMKIFRGFLMDVSEMATAFVSFNHIFAKMTIFHMEL